MTVLICSLSMWKFLLRIWSLSMLKCLVEFGETGSFYHVGAILLDEIKFGIMYRWMAASCLLLWYQCTVLMYAIRVSPVNLVTMHAMVSTTKPKQLPQVPLFLGCSLQFSQCCILLFVLVLQQRFCRHHLRLSQVLKLLGILFRFLKMQAQFISKLT